MLFTGAIFIVAGLLFHEHRILAKQGKAGIPMAFFTLNGIVSVVLGIVGCIDLLI